MKLHGEEVKVGDRVWHVCHGWGEVSGLDDDEDIYYPILVHWEGRDEWFTENGKLCDADRDPSLFWQAIEIPKKQKKPKQKKKAWQWLYFDEQVELYGITYSLYSSAEDFYSRYYRGRYTALAPYLPSEKEREVKE